MADVWQWEKGSDRGCCLPRLIPVGLAVGKLQSPLGLPVEAPKGLDPVKSGRGRDFENLASMIVTPGTGLKGARLLWRWRRAGIQK